MGRRIQDQLAQHAATGSELLTFQQCNAPVVAVHAQVDLYRSPVLERGHIFKQLELDIKALPRRGCQRCGDDPIAALETFATEFVAGQIEGYAISLACHLTLAVLTPQAANPCGNTGRLQPQRIALDNTPGQGGAGHYDPRAALGKDTINGQAEMTLAGSVLLLCRQRPESLA